MMSGFMHERPLRVYWEVTRACALGLGMSVAPSATPLLTSAALQSLHAAGVEAISLSLDGSSPTRHDRLHGIDGTFGRTRVAAAIAREIGLPFRLIRSSAAAPATTCHMSMTRSALDAARWSLFSLVSVDRGQALQPVTPPTGRGHPVVGGGPAGNVREGDVLEISRTAPLFKMLRDADAFTGRCGACEYRTTCGGSRARAYATTGNPLSEDPLCVYTPRALMSAEPVRP